jgi:MerR family mercuric resistance operon transcriptional regulator
MGITELARRAGVKNSTVRYYERSGVLPEPERTSSGYRDYDEEALRYLKFLRRGQELGFALSALAEFAGYSVGVRHGGVDRAALVEIAEAQLSDLDERIDDLRRTRAAIKELLDSECLDPTVPCPIITAFAESPSFGNRPK